MQSDEEAEDSKMDTSEDAPSFIAHVPVPSQKEVGLSPDLTNIVRPLCNDHCWKEEEWMQAVGICQYKKVIVVDL